MTNSVKKCVDLIYLSMMNFLGYENVLWGIRRPLTILTSPRICKNRAKLETNLETEL